MLRVVCLALVALVALTAAQEDGPLVETAYGTVRGTRHVDATYSSFTGIRYAQAPTGRNRFGNASPPPSWQGIFEADRNDIACPQIEVDTFIGINDCLTLNVYTPDVASPDNPVAVMVYFHGGGFVTGSVTHYSHDFLIKHDVVVVLVNFRISALGHLCLRHELIPGNAAFKDQAAALRWVQQNIAGFGGDPDNVTIMGHSAGAASIELLTLSPMTDGLFNRAISASGSALAFWTVNSDPVGHATTLAQTYLGFNGDSIEDLVDFLLDSSDEELAHAATQYQADTHYTLVPVNPCVEQTLPGIEAFLTDTPTNIMESGQYTPVPKIYVVAIKEYVNMILPSEVENAEDLMQNLETYLPPDLVFPSDQQRTEIANRVRGFYVSNEKSILESYIDYMSDIAFYHSISRAARVRQSHSTEPIYMLEFTYESERRLPRLPETDGITAAGHGDDMLYVVMSTTLGLPISPEDQVTIDRYTTLLTNFAKYNNPTPDINDLQWPPLSATQFPYLELGSEVAISQSPNAAAMELWDQIYAELERPRVQTAQGLLRGTHHLEGGYSSFTGMRYAQAPTGRNRFGSASPPPSWQGIFEADRNDIACPQIEVDTFIGINDCLTLNVYTPDVASPDNPVAVMVYFHGGGFVTGSVTYYSHDFLIKHDVVVVLVNFRISALGHLCLRHELIPGNAAFKDQAAALRWVQQNIAGFGGDPDNVTIMGHSAGAASVELLTLSPMTDGLFNRAISVSGSALAFWIVNSDPVGQATTLAQTYLGFNGDSIEDLVDFLLDSSDEELAHAATQYQADTHFTLLPVTPCVEETLPGIEAFLTDTPTNIMESGQYTPVPKIYVVAIKEYVNMILPSEVENAEDLMQNLETYLPPDLVFQSDQQRTEIANRVRGFYISDEKSILESYIDYMSDIAFYHSISRAARVRQSHSTEPIYMLEFTYESERRLPRLPETDGITAAGHGDDILYVVMSTTLDLPISPEDQVTIDRYTTLLTNFAKYNNPTPDVNDLQWPPLSATQFPYLELGSEVAISQSPNAAAMELWDQIYAELERPHVQTAQGLVRGTHHLEGGYSSFTGMRYAQAPTGRNRFGSASPPPSWQGIFEADRNDISCPQIQVDTFIGINDCLTINVYTPDVATPENPVAVIVYFYGGGFTTGTVTLYGHDFLIKHDVVVVLANFRINALGLLCLRHEHIPGNAAFKDQVAALHWVQQNIRAFGGDPDNVTIMGHSGGAISVELLTLSPMAEGLFNRAIEGGGSALAFWAVNSDPVGHATTIAQAYLGYDGDSTEDLVEFFLEIDDEALTFATTQYQSDMHNDHNMTFAVTPCVEQILPGIEAFLTDSPTNIMESGLYTPVPKLYVVANKEYVNMLLPSEIENVEDLMESVENQLPTDLVFQSDQQRTEIANRVREFYVSNEKSILESYVDFMSDIMFYHSITRAARERQSHSTEPIYMSEFTYESERRLPRWPETSGINAAGHGDDMLYSVMITTLGLPISPEDQVTIDKYTTMLTNFAKYNEPTPQNDPIAWLPVSDEQLHYLELGSELSVSHSPNAAAIAFWDEIYAAGTSARILPSLFAIIVSAFLVMFRLN